MSGSLQADYRIIAMWMVMLRCRRDGAAVKKDEFDADVERPAVGSNSRGMRTSSLGATTLTFSASRRGAGAADAGPTPNLRLASSRGGARGYARSDHFHAAVRDRTGPDGLPRRRRRNRRQGQSDAGGARRRDRAD